MNIIKKKSSQIILSSLVLTITIAIVTIVGRYDTIDAYSEIPQDDFVCAEELEVIVPLAKPIIVASKAKPPATVVTKTDMDKVNANQVKLNIASGAKDFVKGKTTIDYSNSNKGYVMVKHSSDNGKKNKIQIVYGDKKYNYDLNKSGIYEAFPLQMGNGKYNVRVMENTSGTKYQQLCTVSFDAKIINEYETFLYPNQYVDYTEKTKAIEKSFEICKNLKTDVEKLTAIYSWVTDNIVYDKKLAVTVEKGYLPDLDTVFNTKKGICFDYASLLAAMTRVQNIPSRLIIGTVSASDLDHAWNEVYLEGKGWVTVKVYFDGNTWKRMDSTFGASKDKTIDKFIGDGKNYTALRVY